MAPNHAISLELEHIARKALNIDSRGGMGGLIDADTVDAKEAYAVMCAALAPYYKFGDSERRARISQFIDDHGELRRQFFSNDEEYFNEVQRLNDDLGGLLAELE